MVIAETHLFEYIHQEWKDYFIRIHKPQLDEVSTKDYFCIIEIGNDDVRKQFGIDSLQAIILAVGYVKIKMKELKENGLRLFHNKDMNQEVDIDVLLRNDLSFYMNIEVSKD